jgi:HSP20 family molecular chaperone IbpA
MSFLMRRTFRDFDPLFDPRSWPFADVRKTFGEFPWTPALEMTERDDALTVKLLLPEGVNFKEVTATIKKGVLEVTVPLRAATAGAPHNVPIAGDEPATVKVAA